MRVLYPTYYDESVDAAYPFAGNVSRSNGSVRIDDDIFVDARLYPPDGSHDLYVSEINIGNEITVTLANGGGEVATGSFDRNDPPDEIHFTTSSGAYVGLLRGYVNKKDTNSIGIRGLRKLAGWSDGTYSFGAVSTQFAPTVVVPQPQQCVRSITLESGEVFTGDVYLVGERGVQLTVNDAVLSSSSSQSISFDNVIRVDVIGDPLYVRRECEDEGIDMTSDRIIKKIRFDGSLIEPDETGGFKLMVGKDATSSDAPALRLTPIVNGLRVGFLREGN